MSKKDKVKMTKDIVPEGFSYSLVAVDLLPVLFFGGTGVLLGLILGNPIVIGASIVAFISGFLKVLWKLIVVMKKKNVWSLFLQMRIFMPIGMLALLIGIIISVVSDKSGVWARMVQLPQLIFFILGIAGMGMMGYFGSHLDSSDPKANWIEQITNVIAQGFIFIGMLIVFIG